jgi:hypothetical protein
MIEFLFVFLMFVGIIFLTLQFTLIANARSMLNLATYAAARDYAVNYSSGSAYAAAGVYMEPLLPGVGSGDITAFYLSIPDDPGFGNQFTIKTTAPYKLMPLPVVQEFFGFVAEHTGYIELKSSCSMTME